jgi:two-component system, NarL family, response regulator NreC
MTEASRSGEEITVVLADDHAVVRGALRALLEAQEGVAVVGEASDLESARATVRAERPQVLILDVNMPDGVAVESLGDLRAEAPGTEVVLLTMERNPSLAHRAIDAGARAYLLKDAAHLELIEAVRRAAAGENYFSPALNADAEEEGDGSRRPGLSPRETEVLRLVALGYTNREIAEQLALSVRTVETHRAHVQQKLGIDSRPEMTRYALDRGLISP